MIHTLNEGDVSAHRQGLPLRHDQLTFVSYKAGGAYFSVIGLPVGTTA
jgi:hypothetical protein